MLRSDKTTFVNMSNTCQGEAYMPLSFDETIDFTNLSGTNCYLDDDAARIIRDELDKREVSGVHYIDNGNYHYLSLLYLEMIEEDFALVVFDNHPDMQTPAFGDIISCGGWVKLACERLSNLKQVYMIGMDDDLIEEVRPMSDKVVYCRSHRDGNWLNECKPIDTKLPLVISLDLDVLSSDDFHCQWSQGIMRGHELKENVQEILRCNDVIFLDVCG